MVAFVGAREFDYMSDIEVTVPNGDVDCLLWGVSDRLTYAVEIETSPTEETIQSKIDRYVHEIPPIDDIVVLNANDAPLNMIESADWIQEQL
jgi:hypothetical protein